MENTYNATSLQQLYKLVSDTEGGLVNKEVFPTTVVQAIFDGLTGIRLDQILALNNSVYVPYKGSSEATRLAVQTDMRRKGLIITFRDAKGYVWTQRYKNERSVADEAWKDSDNWEAWDFDTLLSDVSDIVYDIFKHIDEYPEITDYIQAYIEAYGGFSIQVVTSLPATGADGVIYMILNEESKDDSNVYDEYVWCGPSSQWEKLGSYTTNIDLSNYVTHSELTSYAKKSDLSTYATKSELSSYATTSSVTTQLATKADKSSLSSYATTSALNSAVSTLESSISNKADSSSVYTKTEAESKFQAKGEYLTANSLKTINGNSLVGTGNITIESSAGGSTVTYTPTLTSGVKVGTLTVDGTANTLYAPEGTPPTDEQLNSWMEANFATYLANYMEGNPTALDSMIAAKVTEYLDANLEAMVGEYYNATVEYMQQNERVVANALARHESAITDLQNA